MNKKEMEEDYKLLKAENKRYVSRLTRVLRVINAYSMVGETKVPIKDIFEIITTDEIN